MVEERLSPFFQVGVHYRRLFLAIRAWPYLRHYKLMVAHLYLFFTCSLYRSFKLLDKESNPYGETPYCTLDKIARRFGVISRDVVFDLGSGRGLASLWWALCVGCKAVGVDNYPPFIRRANEIKRRLGILGVEFVEESFLEVDLSRATVIYLYGTALSDEMIHKLIARFMRLDRHVKIITVSYPLSEYHSAFQTVDQCIGFLPWGRAMFYLNHLNHV